MTSSSISAAKNSNRNDASPAGRPGRVRCKDAGSSDMSHIGATEDAAARRTGRSDGSRLHFDSSSKRLFRLVRVRQASSRGAWLGHRGPNMGSRLAALVVGCALGRDPSRSCGGTTGTSNRRSGASGGGARSRRVVGGDGWHRGGRAPGSTRRRAGRTVPLGTVPAGRGQSPQAGEGASERRPNT
jgi:hypothetical protein